MDKSSIMLRSSVENLHMPENLAIGMMVAEQHEKCRQLDCDFDYYGFAFGQSPFHVPPLLRRMLQENADYGGYVPAGGIPELRQAVADFYQRHFRLDASAERVIIGPGTKTLIYMILNIVEGDVIIPSPAWIGYAPQASLLDKHWHVLPLSSENDYCLQPGELDTFLRSLPQKQHLLILNNPNNPTGHLYTQKELEALIQVCRRHGTLVLADEIYALTTYSIKEFTSIGSLYPEGTFVTGGLSKDRSAGGYRLGVCILPSTGGNALTQAFEKMAATLYTSIPTPIQRAAVSVYSESEEMEAYFQITREIHRIMGRIISTSCNKIPGLKATLPQGGFYFFLDFQALAEGFRQKGLKTSNQLGLELLDHPHHIATVTGEAVMLSPDTFGARIAFVDYDGKAAYNYYRTNPPGTKEEEMNFVRKTAPRMLEGVQALENFVRQYR